ncbi:hypothetical protein J7I98_40460 [Streptomyces sp. ISL-98]|uniref:hypothetical protein n=1 Tax=Streptomyces sp. ISL-98 TaxID=2819192 RepID=UPI001BE6B4A2|nr:hypothetical protein [Streptomyces sp. ISL-98]MBT2511913.1 hypothetical protein [Streptomyces sp. ISL-98]
MTYEQLVRSWSETGQDRYGPEDVQDQAVLECARALAEDPGGELAYRRVFGLVLMLPYTELAAGDVPRGYVRELRCRFDVRRGVARPRE